VHLSLLLNLFPNVDASVSFCRHSKPNQVAESLLFVRYELCPVLTNMTGDCEPTRGVPRHETSINDVSNHLTNTLTLFLKAGTSMYRHLTAICPLIFLIVGFLSLAPAPTQNEPYTQCNLLRISTLPCDKWSSSYSLFCSRKWKLSNGGRAQQ
jgi:hypothetical protein